MANCVSMVNAVNVIFGLHMSATNQQLLSLSVVRVTAKNAYINIYKTVKVLV